MKARRKNGFRLIVGMGAILLPGFVIAASIAWHDTLSAPEVLKTDVSLVGLDTSGERLKVLLLSDLHVAGPDMPPERLEEIVAQANALNPDIVMLAGDFVSDKRSGTKFYSLKQALAPLAKLQPRIGSVGVLGNHDHWRDADEARRVLEMNGIHVLSNEARRIGPLTVGGLDDDFTGHANVETTVNAMRRLGPPFILLSHSPDPFPDIPLDFPLALAGHTHCGQIRYPWGGTPATMSRYGDRYACGRVDENGRTLIVSAGLGTSVLPFRFGTRPDMWLITLHPHEKRGPD